MERGENIRWILNRSYLNHDRMKAFWNERYGKTDYAYGKAPNVFFAEQIKRQQPGKLLLPAEGEGRNAVFAAKLGWEVTAFDQSEAGRDKALALAETAGVQIDYQVSSFEDFEEEEAEYFDALALIFAHLPAAQRQKAHRRLLRFLKPGALVLLEGFSKKQLGLASGGPKKEALLFSKSELLEDFQALAQIEVQALESFLEEGPFHQGKAQLLRLVGEK